MSQNNNGLLAWQWSWTDLCGPEGLKIWSPQRHDIGLCFQQLFLQIPVLFILAVASSYFFGRQNGFVARSKLQLFAIKIRSITVFILALLPALQIYIDANKSTNPINHVSFLLSAVQGITWLTHFIYTLALRKRLGLSPRGPVFMCVVWSLLFVLYCISLRSHYLLYKYSITTNYSINLSYGFSICNFIMQLFYAFTLLPGDSGSTFLNFNHQYTEIGENQPLLNNAYVRFSEEGDPNYLGVALEEANWFSKALFYWVNPLMEKGVYGRLRNSDDLYDLPINLNSHLIGNKLEKALIGNVDQVHQRHESISSEASTAARGSLPDVSFVRRNNVSLVRALHKCFAVQFYSIAVLRFIADCSAFAGPMLLNKLVAFVEDKSEDVKWGYIYAAGLMSTTFIASMCDSHFNFFMSLTQLRMRAALVTTIYRKTLSVSSSVLSKEFSFGEIINFMSTDTDRIVNSCPSFHSLWSTPFQLSIALYLLYSQLGLAFLAGLAFSVLLIPVNKLIANQIGKLSTKLMEEKDGRVKMLAEVLKGIKAIKLYVWEQHFIRVINKIRERELKYLKGRKYLDALCVYFWATTPVIISILTFSTYVLMGNKLTAATVFTGVALLNMLIFPLNAFPWVLNGMIEAWVSVKRIQKFIDLPDLDLDQFYHNELLDDNSEIVIRDGSFNWGRELTTEQKLQLHDMKSRKIHKNKGKGKKSLALDRLSDGMEENIIEEEHGAIFMLTGINFHIKKGEFVGIVGAVGCGKSSVLSAILAELTLTDGQVAINQLESGFGIVTQQIWLQNGTIRDNILFGKAFDDGKYKSVLSACGLAEDIYLLPSGDLTNVGEGGMTLSGGQKARVALARAVYQDKLVYLLDDVLSAVDVKVAKHIFQHCIRGLLKNKTVLLCTHHVQYLGYADRIVVMENGSIKEQGKPANILRNIDDSLAIDLELGESLQSSSSASFLESGKHSVTSKESPDKNDIEYKETSETGTLSNKVYFSYWISIGHFLSLMILMSVIMMQMSKNVSDWWLSHWVTISGSANNSTNLTIPALQESNPLFLSSTVSNYLEIVHGYEMQYYLKIYIELAVFNTIFTLLRAFIFAYGGIVAATKIHKSLLKSIMKAKLSFFDVTPTGRILNRFSSDTYTVDDTLPFILNILLAQLFNLIGVICVTIYGLPWICLILVPLIPVYHWLQNHYRMASRELKRISSVTLSPVYSHFNETLHGLITIRGMRASQRFRRDNEDNVDANLKAQFASNAASRWLGLRLQFIGVAIVTGVSFIAVIQHQWDVADPGLVGLSISYALSVTGSLGGVVNAFTETEREMIAVERINQYINEVSPETVHFITDPPFGWPNQGVITFTNVVLKHREYLTPALKGVSFETRPMEKIGIAGRTGAGKSSIIAALFRLAELTSGSICIDSVNIQRISLATLRSRMFCIPQDPFLFSGTIRDNLDPLGEFRDNEIWSALNKVNLVVVVNKLGGLDKKVDNGGVNFSVGQKQLICLARAILHNAKILCIDEATANVDHDTDRQIQLTLRSAFRKSTVLTIAHRIQTILDSDRVLVMDDGQVVEFDQPDNLLSNPSTFFYRLANQE